MIKKILEIVFLITVLLPLMLLTNTCKKKDSQVNFTGKVIDPGNNQAVPDAIVTLASTSVQTWVYSSNFQDIASINSGQDGSFAFNFKEQAASAYRIYIYKSNYFTNTTIINANEVTSEAGYYNTFELNPEATIALNVKNTMPHDTSDRILFRIVKGAVSCANGCSESYVNGKGQNYDTTITCKTYGNRYFIVESNITKGANTVLRRDSIHLNPFVTTGLNVYY